MRHLKIDSLPGSKIWIDRDHIMLHACFQILQDCVEKEDLLNHCNYEAHKQQVDEVRFLYNWWMERKKDWGDEDTEDDEMLIRLMKIRTFL